MADSTDCDDDHDATSPAAGEVCGDFIDNDCDGTANACFPASASLSEGLQFVGESEGDHAGDAVAGAGDVNGDGFDDLIVGAYTAGQSGSGAVYLILGSGSPASSSLRSVYAEYTGETPSSYAGGSVAAAGDVDGDGFDDMLVGASGAGREWESIGAAYLVLGSTWPGSGSLAEANAEYTGEAIGDYAGVAVSSAGDFDGDGLADIVVGAFRNEESGTEAGAAYLVLGSASPASTSLRAADAKYTGEAPSDNAGFCVAAAGDADGDGLDDLLVGAWYNDEGGGGAGAAYLLLGAKAPADASLALADAKYTGEAVSDSAGRFVASAGDVNGDGFDDILVGAQGNDDGGSNSGAAYLVLGSRSPAGESLTTADAQYTGPSGAVAGSVASAGDVDGDGFDDIVVGASGDDDAGTDAGAAYLVRGSITPFSASLSAADAQFTGETAGDNAGDSVSAAGDVDSDGFADLLVGAYNHDDGGTNAGAAYLIFGSGL